MECTAEDYNERVGPYEVNFTLPNDIVSNTEVNKTIINGPLFNLYVIELQIPGNKYKRDVDHFRGQIVTAHLNETSDMDLNITEIMKNFDKEGLGRMYHDCTSIPQIINDQYWIIVYCSGGDRISDYCAFGYQLDNRNRNIWIDISILDSNCAAFPEVASCQRNGIKQESDCQDHRSKVASIEPERIAVRLGLCSRSAPI